MRLYHLRTNIAEDLLQGYYTRNELGLSELTLLNLIENGDIEITNKQIECLLITNNGFKRTISLPEFRSVIQIPIRESLSVRMEIHKNTVDPEPELGRDTFVFDYKVRGKNKFIYRQL